MNALKVATEAARACEEPQNIKVCASIRDDPAAREKDRISAIECLRGPRPLANTVVNIQQNNANAPQPAGYVIRLDKDFSPTTIEGKAVPASPRGNTGDVEQDVAREQAEARANRDRVTRG
jgi:hypothetical protein